MCKVGHRARHSARDAMLQMPVWRGREAARGSLRDDLLIRGQCTVNNRTGLIRVVGNKRTHLRASNGVVCVNHNAALLTEQKR
jgi:hypothetical protein